MNEREIEAGLAKTASYRYATRVGTQLFIAGQVPHDRDSNLIGANDPGEQARQCLRNLRTLMTCHGFTEDDLQKLTVYVVGEPPNLDQAWEAVSDWYDREVPPATLLGVARLGYEGQLVEIDATIIAMPE